MYKTEKGDFLSDIKRMTKSYEQPINEKPTFLGKKRIESFKSVLMEEVGEVDNIISKLNEDNISEDKKMEVLTDLSDWLGDIIVYCSNESAKHGIPIDEVLEIIMQSNFSKLGVDGKPIKDERGKFLKGPNYWAPEEKIKELLLSKIKSN